MLYVIFKEKIFNSSVKRTSNTYLQSVNKADHVRLYIMYHHPDVR